MRFKSVISILLLSTIFMLTACGTGNDYQGTDTGNTGRDYNIADLINEEHNKEIDAEIEAIWEAEDDTDEIEDVSVTEISETEIGGFIEPKSTEMTGALNTIFNKAVMGTGYNMYEAYKFMGTQMVIGTNYKFMCKDEEGRKWILVIHKDENEILSVIDAERVLD